ncbi:MAG: Succinate dehydrogenase cytochrome b-556 subunit [Devosia sp.]|nr:Succinate dehydrogenase cytochrome b-556 subunit [Devosia sp.]
MAARSRPLSPHLSIYRFTITMVVSIVHRITGIALYAGTVLLVGWLLAGAWGPVPLAYVNGFFAHWFGTLVLIGYTWALFQHLLGGVRYFFWDATAGMGAGQREAISWANVIGAVLLTVIAWSVYFMFRETASL